MKIEYVYGERYQEESFSKEPRKKYYFACEGKKTEYQYLKGIDTFKSQLNLDPLIEIVPLKHEKETSSNPKKLKEEAEAYLQKCLFSEGLDKFILVVDRDKKSFTETQYDEVLCDIKKNADYQLVVSNPCFELWLYFHHTDLSKLDLVFIADNPKVDVDKKTKTPKRTYIENCLKERQKGSYSKTRLRFESYYKDKIKDAILNAEKYCVDVNLLKDKVGTNFGELLKSMMK